MRRGFRLTKLTIWIALLALVVAACGSPEEEAEPDPTGEPADEEQAGSEDGELEELVAAAQEEGQLVWYSTLPEGISDRVGEAFEAKYGVRVDFIRLASGAMVQRYSSERDAGVSEADVLFIVDPVFFAEAHENGWLVELDESMVPALADWPEEFWSDTGAYGEVSIQPQGFLYNTTLVDEGEAPETWEDIVDPQWQDQIQLVDPRGVPGWLATMKLLADEYGDDFLREFGELNPVLVDSAVPGAQNIAAGERAIGLPNLSSIVQPLADQGAPVEFVIPDTTIGTVQTAGVSEGGPNPNAALLFMQYILTEEGQQVLNEEIAASPLGDLEGTIPLPSDYRPAQIEEAIAESDRLVELLGLD